MSFDPDNKEHETDLTVILEQILKELMLLNARIEEAFETKIFGEDIE